VAVRGYSLKQTVLFRKVADEAVILDVDTGIYYGLDPVATRVWQLLEEGHAMPAVCDAVLKSFDASPDVIRQDVEAFVSELESAGMVAKTP